MSAFCSVRPGERLDIVRTHKADPEVSQQIRTFRALERKVCGVEQEGMCEQQKVWCNTNVCCSKSNLKRMTRAMENAAFSKHHQHRAKMSRMCLSTGSHTLQCQVLAQFCTERLQQLVEEQIVLL